MTQNIDNAIYFFQEYAAEGTFTAERTNSALLSTYDWNDLQALLVELAVEAENDEMPILAGRIREFIV